MVDVSLLRSLDVHGERPASRAGRYDFAGTALLRAIETAALEAGARRLWLITTNDNTRAMQFYQRRGFDLVAFHRDAVTRTRAALKPSIPLEVEGIAVRHELELERILR
jgi:N-acetylglutamate synthase-like GNAT family acetyltransferase